MAAFSAFPATREAAASDSCDGLMSRLDKHTLETPNEYHIPPPVFNPT